MGSLLAIGSLFLEAEVWSSFAHANTKRRFFPLFAQWWLEGECLDL